MDLPRVERSVVLPVGVAEAWAALVEEDALSAWFGADARIEECTPGGHIEFRGTDGGVRVVVIEEVVLLERLTFRWLPFERTPAGPRGVPPGRVEITLEACDEGTKLTVLEIGSAHYPVMIEARR